MRQKVYTNTIEFILCCLPTAGHGACRKVWLMSQCNTTEDFSFASVFLLLIGSRFGAGCAYPHPSLSTDIHLLEQVKALCGDAR